MTSLTTRPRNLNENESAHASRLKPTIPHAAGTPHERLLFVTCSLVGKTVTVQTKDGKEYVGLLRACTTEKEMGVILGWARLKVGLDEPVPKPSREMVFLAKDFVQITACDIDLLESDTGAARKNKGELLADTEIEVAGRGAAEGRELQKATAWLTEEGLEGGDLKGDVGGMGWDQFARNEQKFGLKSTYNEELYTTKLSNKQFTKEQMERAARLAAEIESKPATSSHVAEERGQLDQADDGMDEEDKYSTVLRGAEAGEAMPEWAQPVPAAATAVPPAAAATAMPATGPVSADAAASAAAVAPAAAPDDAAPAVSKPVTTKLRATAAEFVPGGGAAKSFSPAGPGAFASGYGSAMPPGAAAGYQQQPGMMMMDQQQQAALQMQMVQQQQAAIHRQQIAVQQQMMNAQMMNGVRPMMMAPMMGQQMMMPQQAYPNGAARPMMGPGQRPPRAMPPQSGYATQMATRPAPPGYPQ